MDLNTCRSKIDEIDQELLRLFAERMDVVTQVAAYKLEHNLPILNSSREQDILEQKLKESPEEIKEYVRSFFSHLIETSKCYQMRILDHGTSLVYEDTSLQDSAEIRVVCQGTQGAYQHIAAKALFQSATVDFCKSYPDVFDSVKNGSADYGVVPLENSTAGTVDHVYDLLRLYDLYINKTHMMKIEHCLAAKPGTKLADITAVYSYVQALNQCSDFLHQHAEWEAHDYPNTALAAEMTAGTEAPIAAICSKECARLFGLDVLCENIQNNSENYTRFIVISKKLLNSDTHDEVSICIQIPNQPGELNKMLTKFSLYSINMTKIESRPIGGKDFSVLFYLNFKGNLKDRNVSELLHDLEYNYDFCKLLGGYQAK